MSLPSPSIHEIAHSRKLTLDLHQMIEENGGKIPFSRYMEFALYAPDLGYYMTNKQKLGKTGDFVTAPEISSLFGQCLADTLPKLLGQADKNILEFGAGSGILSAVILQHLEKQGQLPTQYFILEISPALQALQRDTLAARVPTLVNRVQWINTLPHEFSGLVIANEVLDAMPVELFCWNGKEFLQGYVQLHNDQLCLNYAKATPEVLETCQKLRKAEWPVNYCSEINLWTTAWLKSVVNILKKGSILLIDYGFLQDEYYHPSRSMGTLMCHYRHYAHTDPFWYPGIQDITAHVDFSALIDLASALGLSKSFYGSQANFLLESGILDLYEAALQQTSGADRVSMQQGLQYLLQPYEMGELFKVLHLVKQST